MDSSVVSADADEVETGGVLAGIRTAGPAGLAVIPLGLAFGVLITHAGLAWWWGTVFSAVVCAGSFEFLLLGFIITGTPIAQIALSALLANSRHVFYALSFPLHRLPGGAKLYGTYALTDEAWALTATPEAQRWRARRILAIQATFHGTWVASVSIGGLIGQLIPSSVRGLDFALTALFIVLAIDAIRANREKLPPVVAATCAAIAGVFLGSSMLIGGIGLYAVFLIVHTRVNKTRTTDA